MTEDELPPLSRETDHLATLARQLAELTGTPSFVNELLQNADDAGASTFRITITEEGITVWNSGEFSSCEHLEEQICPWLADRPHRCDFHSFRNLGAGDKQARSGVTGAFGVGFTAVYQFTDHPELIAGSQHWTFHDEAESDQRVRRAPVSPPAVGTEFRLPWAYDGASPMRRVLKRPAVQPGFHRVFSDEVRLHLPAALLFLNNVTSVEVVDETGTAAFTRSPDGDSVTITGPNGSTNWQLLTGDSTDEVCDVMAHYAGLFNDRSTCVQVAVAPEIETGLLYATLPTNDRAGLPVHINAFFVPRSDRKGVLFDTSDGMFAEPEVAWNRAQLRTAAALVAANLEAIANVIGSEATWVLLGAAQETSAQAAGGQRDPVFSAFFESVKGQVASARITPDTSGTMIASRDLVVPRREEVYDCEVAIAGLGLHVVHPDLRSLVFSKRVAEYGLENLTLDTVVSALDGLGFTVPIEPADLHPLVGEPSEFRSLLRLLAQLLADGPSSRSVDRLRDLYVFPSTDGWRDKAECTVRCNERELRQLGALLHGKMGVLDEGLLGDADAFGLAELVDQISPSHLLDAVEDDHEQLLSCLRNRAPEVSLLLEFISEHRGGMDTWKDRIGALPMFPSAGEFRPLSLVSLPGGFDDPLGIASVVSMDVLGPHSDLLRLLGANELNLTSYIEQHIPEFFEPDEVDPDTVEALRRLLAEHLGQIQDRDEVRVLLREQPLIQLASGYLCAGPSTYWPNETVRAVLGEADSVANPPSSASVASLYRYLGVREQPELEDVEARCRSLSSRPPSSEALESVAAILRHLTERLQSGDSDFSPERVRAGLASIPWLPTEGSPVEWQLPVNLDASFNRQLFESTGNFIGLSLPFQRSTSKALDELGVNRAPTADQLVGHLLNLSNADAPASKEMYDWLNDRAAEPALNRLTGKRCLYLDGVGYVRFTDVFLSAQPFGSWRHQLPASMLQFIDLLQAQGTQESPSWRDAVAVLQEIEDEFQTEKLDADTSAVLQSCWRFLTAEVEAGSTVGSDLRDLASTKCVPDGRGMLALPRRVFFDNMPQIAEHLKDMRHLLIRRPVDLWKGMAAAGVRGLTEVTRLAVVDLVEPIAANWLTSRLRERQELLRRLVDVYDPDVRVRLAEVIDSMEVTTADQVRVSIQVGELGMTPTNPAVDAVLVDRHLYVAGSADRIPWSAIARELERAIAPDSEPGQLSSAIRTVLSAESATSAADELDALGVARLDAGFTHEPIEREVLGIGTEDYADQSDAEEDSSHFGFDSDLPPDSAGVAAGVAYQETFTNEGSAPAQDPPVRIGATGPDHDRATGARGGDNLPVDRTKRKGGEMVLRSYVRPHGEVGDLGDSPGTKTTERGAIDAAMEYERRNGRFPTEMPPMNAGFDIESRNSEGEVVRWIEVKGLASSWERQPAEVTRHEFKVARDKGERYFLYIVDGARSDDDRILHAICDPAGQVDRYVFDDGWIAVTDDIWQDELPDPPDVSLRNEAGPDTVPFFSPVDFDPTAPPTGFIEVSGSFADGAFATQIDNGVRGRSEHGRIIIVQPIEPDFPLDGEYIFVDLSRVPRRLACGPRTYARWLEVDAADGETQVQLDLGPLGTATLTSEELDATQVLGRARLLGHR